MSDQLYAETSKFKTHNPHKRRIPMLPAGFEPAISTSVLQQKHALDRAATGVRLKTNSKKMEACLRAATGPEIRLIGSKARRLLCVAGHKQQVANWLSCNKNVSLTWNFNKYFTFCCCLMYLHTHTHTHTHTLSLSLSLSLSQKQAILLNEIPSHNEFTLPNSCHKLPFWKSNAQS